VGPQPAARESAEDPRLAGGPAANSTGDPYLAASFPLSNRLMRLVWGIVYALLFRPSPRPAHAWRSFLLRCFGARMGPSCHIYPKAVVWAPWNLCCDDAVGIADGATVYNPSPIVLGSHATISQEAYLCGATHDYEDPAFPLVSAGISIGAYAWVCARATVQPGISVGEGAVLALGSVATRNLDAWTVYAGIPARAVKKRSMKGAEHAAAGGNR
jgi:putative colanic acid biosynthesis acetyltransferase WcaF